MPAHSWRGARAGRGAAGEQLASAPHGLALLTGANRWWRRGATCGSPRTCDDAPHGLWLSGRGFRGLAAKTHDLPPLWRTLDTRRARRSHRGAAETNPTRTREVVGWIPGLAHWVKDPCGCELWCRLQTWLRSRIAVALA